MKTQDKTQQKKFLLALPLLVAPFLTLAFWALGGGQGSAQAAAQPRAGLNLKLPDAHNGRDDRDKMSYYDQAARDSLKRKEQMGNDPYHHSDSVPALAYTNGTMPGNPGIGTNISTGMGYRDPNEAKVYEKLQALQQAMNQPQQPAFTPQQQPYSNTAPTMNPADIDRLEKMMKTMQQPGSETGDPETAQLNSMLEKILDIQHPDRIEEKIKQKQEDRKGQVYAVAGTAERDKITALEVRPDKNNQAISGFFGLDDSASNEEAQNAISAVIHEDQTLVSGATVKLRLTDAIQVNGITIPRDNFIYGTAQLDGERLSIRISSLRYKKSLFPVQLSVFDIDGMDGIYIPGAITRDVAKQSADRSLQSIGLTSFDPSIGAQAASAGIEAAKTLISKKVKLVKVFVKAGYKVLLRDEKQKDGQ